MFLSSTESTLGLFHPQPGQYGVAGTDDADGADAERGESCRRDGGGGGAASPTTTGEICVKFF